MITHTLFPTTICEFEYERSSDFKEKVWEVGLDHINNIGNQEIHDPYVQHDDSLSEIYSFITKSVQEYLNLFNIDMDELEFYISKSYFNVLDAYDNNGRHHHKDSHISFIYYANIPDSFQSNICFYAEHINEPHSNFFEMFNRGGWNIYNSSSWSFVPQEGHLFIFPGTVPHEVLNGEFDDNKVMGEIKTVEQLKDKRISIVGDGMFTFKNMNQQKHTHGLQPVSSWKTFNV